MPAFTSKHFLCGEYKRPRQMLGDQTYDGHLSIHDDNMAENLGFSGAPIEGPTHFSMFVPLLYEVFGNAWFETGCISAHYQNMVVDGEEVRAFVESPEPSATITNIWAEKRDGTPVLSGTAAIGPDHGESALDQRRAKLRPHEQLVILADLEVGMTLSEIEPVIMDFNQHMGDNYPFTLNEKLNHITESSPWYTQQAGSDSPWGRAIIPLEMISVLTQYSSKNSSFPQRGPAIGLFADQEIKLIKGPLFVNHPYRLEREIVNLSESRRVESLWVLTSVYDGQTNELVAECLLNSSTLKESYAKYEEDAKALGRVLN